MSRLHCSQCGAMKYFAARCYHEVWASIPNCWWTHAVTTVACSYSLISMRCFIFYRRGVAHYCIMSVPPRYTESVVLCNTHNHCNSNTKPQQSGEVVPTNSGLSRRLCENLNVIQVVSGGCAPGPGYFSGFRTWGLWNNPCEVPLFPSLPFQLEMWFQNRGFPVRWVSGGVKISLPRPSGQRRPWYCDEQSFCKARMRAALEQKLCRISLTLPEKIDVTNWGVYDEWQSTKCLRLDKTRCDVVDR